MGICDYNPCRFYRFGGFCQHAYVVGMGSNKPCGFYEESWFSVWIRYQNFIKEEK